MLNYLTIKSGNLVSPCVERSICGITGLSYGLGPASYDIRTATGGVIEPRGFMLATSVEYFSLPDFVAATMHDKSTLIRSKLTIGNPFINPGWKGYLTLELFNHSDEPFTIHPGQPIGQVVFSWVDGCTDGYSGRYQDQEQAPVGPRDFTR